MTDRDFSGINPENLQATIQSLSGDAESLSSFITSYKKRFQSFSIETGSFTELQKVTGWVGDELPMLRRRQGLAAAMEADKKGFRHLGTPMIKLPEPVSSASSARKGGKDLAKEVNEAAELDRAAAGKEFHRISAALARHKDDPDFLSAFYAAMDKKFLKELPATIVAANSPTAKEDMRSFASAFSTAVATENPAPGFSKTVELFHGDLKEDEPAALFNRALMQDDSPELWERAWWHLNKAYSPLIEDPVATWPDNTGLLFGVLGFQAQYAQSFWDKAQAFSDEAALMKENKLNGMSKEERRKFKNAAGRANRAGEKSALRGERILAKWHMGSISRLMEASVADGGGWLASKAPWLRPPSTPSIWGRSLRFGGKLPLVGTVLTVAAVGWDIKNGEEKDVAVAAGVGGMAAGALGVAAGVALVGGPVGWGIAAGIVIGFGLGVAAGYLIKHDKIGRPVVNAVSGAVKKTGSAIGGAASKAKDKIGDLFSW